MPTAMKAAPKNRYGASRRNAFNISGALSAVTTVKLCFATMFLVLTGICVRQAQPRSQPALLVAGSLPAALGSGD
jgi:hypothetical protein